MSIWPWIPKRLRKGLISRRVKKVIKRPLLLFQNEKFWLNDGQSDEFYIFALGPPRSGTTLIKNILRSHSEVCGVDDETHFFIRQNYADFRNPDVPNRKIEKAVQHSSNVPELFEKFARIRKDDTGASFFLEKTTVHALRLQYILEHFPRSKAVFVVRDPRDSFRSAKNNPGVWNGLPSEDPLGAYMETWKRCVQSYFDQRDSPRLTTVQYEEFCGAPEKELRRVMDFLGMKVEKQQLDPSRYGRTRVSERQGLTRLNESISTKTVGKWREALDESEVQRIEELVEDEMVELGYQPVATQ